MTKKLYYISIPFTGTMAVEIECDSSVTEEEVIDKALEECVFNESDIIELEFASKIIQGNVFYGVQNVVSIDAVEEIQDENNSNSF